MIPFRAPMPPSISDPIGDPVTPSEVVPQQRSRWPADYYSTATPKPVLPQWATFGCGAAAVVVLVIVFAGGAFLGGDGLSQFMDFALGMSLGEMRGMYTTEVSKAQRETLDRELETMRAGLRDKKIAVKDIQPVLQTLQKSVRDEKMTPAEVDQLTAAVRKATASRR
jgi:hypothetical protein